MTPPKSPPDNKLTFSSRIVYQNTSPLPAELRRKVSVPSGVDARLPYFRTLAQIVQVQQARGRRFDYEKPGDLGRFAVGYTDTDLTMAFADFGRSWRCEGDHWRFCGGEIVLTLSIGIHVDERANEPSRRRCLEMILTHELLHVVDEIDIVTNWLPSEAPKDALFRANVSADARVPLKHFDSIVRGTGNGGGSDLEKRLRTQLYIFESSDRAAALHKNRPQDSREISACLS